MTSWQRAEFIIMLIGMLPIACLLCLMMLAACVKVSTYAYLEAKHRFESRNTKKENSTNGNAT